MNLKSAIGALVQVLTVVASMTASTVDDSILGLLKALHASDAFLAVLQSWIDKTGAATMPATALPMIDPDNAEFATAFNDSPALKEWAELTHRRNVPDTAEAIGAGGLLTLISYLPQILALLKALKDSGVFASK